MSELAANAQAKLNYRLEKRGSGDAVIMLHGMFGNISNWKPVVEEVSKSFRAIALELPYLELEPRLCSVGVLTEFLANYIESNKLKNVTLIGNSLGGHVALDYTVNYRNGVKRLVLTGSSGLFERGYDEDIQRYPSKEYLSRKIGEVFFDKSHVTEKLVNEVYQLLQSRMNKLKIIRMSKSAKRYNLAGQLPIITCETLLIWGKNDTMIPLEHSKDYKEVPKHEIVIVNDCGHTPYVEKPAEFNQVLLEFLAKPH